MRYQVIVNNDEWMEEDDCSFHNVVSALGELLRSGYITVESVTEL